MEGGAVFALVIQVMICSILIFLAIIWLFLTLNEYIRSRLSSSSVAIRLHFSVPAPAPLYNHNEVSGLEPSVIEGFPKCTYPRIEEGATSKIKVVNERGLSDCGVCLSPYKDNETLRIIPKCGHVFHAGCVDSWLTSHATCPYCRADLRPSSKEELLV